MNFLPNVNEKRWQCVSADVVTLHTGHWAGLWLVNSGGAGLWLAGAGLVTYRQRDNITTLISRHNCHEHWCHSAWLGSATLANWAITHFVFSSTFKLQLFTMKHLTSNVPKSSLHYAFECFLNLDCSCEYVSVIPCCSIFFALFLRWWQNLSPGVRTGTSD